MTASVQGPDIHLHDAAATTSHSKGTQLPWRPSLALFPEHRCLLLSSPLSSHHTFLTVSAAVTLVGSRCAGQKRTRTSAALCGRGEETCSHLLDVPEIFGTEHHVIGSFV
ncbi:hypothetical protein JOB18_015416 [Solea senegalensis]|uniref:Uncharacterized protein n=1 Tax=Solea senegalensis TaxID=28829 RepID=A0AAV6RUN1_SOLSE|nr:hypothetical protein JOB18_015416 [Solea senegalensis]